jgi:hypothetical protein
MCVVVHAWGEGSKGAGTKKQKTSELSLDKILTEKSVVTKKKYDLMIPEKISHFFVWIE